MLTATLPDWAQTHNGPLPSRQEAARQADALLSEIQEIGVALFHELPSDYQDLEYRAGRARWLLRVAMGQVDDGRSNPS